MADKVGCDASKHPDTFGVPMVWRRAMPSMAYLAGGLTRNSRRVRTIRDAATQALMHFYSFTAPVIDET
ncbi:hypothetical protein [Mesorhizobium sp. CA5]|uniref:hypothetical protein n=1 Tax=Mesorhizobium sp. CA5 TaxID=2876638 RepID=UPI001CD0A9F9|nr:hypothetical protein [Mesorhizobium sp. CA5]MBZ9841139.1 hypothetical protein [Mesorhizobium sp. CA5]